jgi:hypothetical protein
LDAADVARRKVAELLSESLAQADAAGDHALRLAATQTVQQTGDEITQCNRFDALDGRTDPQ